MKELENIAVGDTVAVEVAHGIHHAMGGERHRVHVDIQRLIPDDIRLFFHGCGIHYGSDNERLLFRVIITFDKIRRNV